MFVDELSAGGLSLAEAQFLPQVWAGQRVGQGAGERAVGNCFLGHQQATLRPCG